MSNILPTEDVTAKATSGPDEFLESLYESIGPLKHDFRNRNLNRLVAGFVRGESVLDVGCGSGGLVAELRRRGKDAVGLEPNQKLIDIAKHLHPAARIFRGSGDDIAKLGRRFDTVTMVDVLEHILDDLGQLQLFHGCLNPDGQLVLVVPAHPSLFGRRDRLNGHHRRYSRKRLLWNLEATGYKVERLRFWNVAGVAPYWFSERILERPLEVCLRRNEKPGPIGSFIRWLLDTWLRHVENRVGFGCGLSIVCVARRANAAAPWSNSISAPHHDLGYSSQ